MWRGQNHFDEYVDKIVQPEVELLQFNRFDVVRGYCMPIFNCVIFWYESLKMSCTVLAVTVP